MDIREHDSITVRALKYDGTEHRRWHGRLARREGSLIVFDAAFEFDVQHDLLGETRPGTRTIEYYWLDRWYNVFRFLNDNDETRLYYCNVNMPPTFEDGTLRYIDLDIDILVQPDLSYEVLDLDEFERNARLFGYTDETQRRARAAIDELISMIEERQFPFEDDTLRPSAVKYS